MNPIVQRFAPFLLDGAKAKAMRTEFMPILTGTDLSRTRQFEAIVANYKKVPGIYFWVMRHDNAEYKIYIGQTNSLSYRLLNYVSEFQPHSPNDYKLRIFHAFMGELVPDATLDLYFAKEELVNLRDAEKKAISKYEPLLNNLPPPTVDARDELKKAFSSYYRSAFEQRFSK